MTVPRPLVAVLCTTKTCGISLVEMYNRGVQRKLVWSQAGALGFDGVERWVIGTPALLNQLCGFRWEGALGMV